MAASNYFYGLGRRKSATARVRLMNGKGKITINGNTADDYFTKSKSLLAELQKPFTAVEMPSNKYDMTVVVKGGGTTGQVEAIRLGISKAMVEMNGDLKSTLRHADMLGRDPREKERKKYGLKGARKQRQFTKR